MKIQIFLLSILYATQTFAINNTVAIICHGGAGSVGRSRFPGKHRGTVLAAQLGYNVLKAGGSALDAVEAAIKSMEVDPEFNAGYGSVLTREGEVEMEASIMDGLTMNVGAATGIQNIFHPITLARRVMEKTNYNFLGERGSMKLAASEGFQFLPPGTLITQRAINSLETWKKNNNITSGELETVGCAAIDENGNLAAGTSTGGLTGKMSGRIGQAPSIGVGTYADNNLGAMSATGNGEVIMKAVLVFDILKRVQYSEIDIQTASQSACDEMEKRYNGTGGVIGLDKNGNVAIGFSSSQMSWAYQKDPENVYYGINPGDHYTYNIENCKNKKCI